MASFLIRILAFVFGLLTLLLSSASADAEFTPVLPPSYPLAVRNPYLSAWLPGNEAPNLPSAVAQFWWGQQLTWSVIARVDGKAYSLFGVPRPGDHIQPGTLTSADFTATHTTFQVMASEVEFVLDFFSPVSPHDFARQSLPFSYLTVSSSSLNSRNPSVQVYSDMDNAWLGQFGFDSQVTWNWEMTAGNSQVFSFSATEPQLFAEDEDMAQWGTAVYCTRENASKLSRAVGMVDDVRDQFATKGTISGGGDFRPGSVFAYSHDLGSLHGTENVTFVIGLVQEVAVDYLGQERSGYFSSFCGDINCGCVHALDDLHPADDESRTLDAFIAETGSANYSDILALSTRQAFGTIELTIPSDTLDKNKVLAFVKEISSNGNVNTMDVILPMAPIFYVLSPEYIQMLLSPVLEYLNDGRWPHNYTIHDIGSHFPNATAHDDGDAESMPIEECGNLLALMYMYERASGDTAYKEQYSGILKIYADYLVENGLYPAVQLSTDDGAGESAKQTGLAVKAAIGLNAYGVMTNQREYSDAGKHFAGELYDKTIGTDSDRTHFTMFEGNGSTWGLQFNLYLDVLLELNTFPTEAYRMDANFYPSVRLEAGVPLDSRENWAKTDWMIWSAAVAMAPGVNNEGTRDMFVNDVHAYMTNGRGDVPFSDKFWVAEGVDKRGVHHEVGSWDGYRARPVVGGHFALLALKGANQFPGGH